MSSWLFGLLGPAAPDARRARPETKGPEEPRASYLERFSGEPSARAKSLEPIHIGTLVSLVKERNRELNKLGN